jgi:hypothetical protein
MRFRGRNIWPFRYNYLGAQRLSGTAPSRCIEAARAPLERALDTGRPRPRRGPRESWQVASCRSYLCSREGGPHTPPTPEPLRPLGHNANPRDGAQDISQPQKSACEQSSTAPVGLYWHHLGVGPIPPADWGTRSTRSHLGKRPEHEIPDFCSRRGGPGGAPRSGPGLPGEGWGQRWFVFESVPGGIPVGSTNGARGCPKERETRRAKGRLKSWQRHREGRGEARAPIRDTQGPGAYPVWRPLSCPCVAIAALSPITVLRLNM